MATPYRLPSGKWGMRVHWYTDDSGRPHQKRFTAPTKKEVQALAREFEYERSRLATGNLTVSECISLYIEKKRAVLSPTTLDGYETIYRVEFSDGDAQNWRERKAREKRSVRIGDMLVSSLDSNKLQEWINDLDKVVSPKRLKNIYGLLSSSVRDRYPSVRFNVTMPQSVKPEIRVPTSAEVRQLLALSEGTPLHLAIELAAFASLRAGEIAALRRSDLVDGKLSIKHSLARSGRGEGMTWVLKQPKTATSKRIIPIPSFLADEIQAGPERVVDMDPAQISNAYIALVEKSGIEHTRFHDLRHFWASFNHAAAVPDAYLMEWGGWSNDGTLQRIYRNTLADERKRIADRMDKLLTEEFSG